MKLTSPGMILCGDCFPSVTRLIHSVKIGLPSVSGCQPAVLLTSLCGAGANSANKTFAIYNLNSSEKELNKATGDSHTQEVLLHSCTATVQFEEQNQPLYLDSSIFHRHNGGPSAYFFLFFFFFQWE